MEGLAPDRPKRGEGDGRRVPLVGVHSIYGEKQGAFPGESITTAARFSGRTKDDYLLGRDDLQGMARGKVTGRVGKDAYWAILKSCR